MNIRLTNGHLFIDDKEVRTIIFYESLTPIMDFPTDMLEELVVNNTTVSASEGGTAVYQKNVFTGGSIVCGGDFNIGDR